MAQENQDKVSQAQANLLFQSLQMTKEEILAKYPIFTSDMQQEMQQARNDYENKVVTYEDEQSNEN